MIKRSNGAQYVENNYDEPVCKSWFCFANFPTKEKKKNLKNYQLVYYHMKSKKLYFYSSYYVKKHKEAWLGQAKNISTETSQNKQN